MFNLKIPRDLVLAVTYRCNSRCRMCNIWKMEPLPLLNLKEYKKLPKGLRDINISGGEPFLKDDLVELIALINKDNPQARIIISSNGFATDLIIDKTKQILKIKKDIGIGISLDGIGEVHDQIRGIAGGFDKAVVTLKALKGIGVGNLRIAFTAGDYNINQLLKVYNLSKELGVEFTMAAIHNAENYFNVTDNKITKLEQFKKEFRKLIKEELITWSPKRWVRAYFTFALYKFIATGKRLLPNYSGQDNIFIDPLGNVYPSDVSGHLMGNLKDFGNFQDLYASKKAQQAIALEKRNQNWMICTARSAIKRHPLEVIFWILKSKIFGVIL